MDTTVEAALAKTIRDLSHGIVFGLVGDDVALLIARLAALPGVEFFGARHETAAISMADGYARSTGRLGVCIVSRGPGFSNALTGLIAARKAASPVLVLLGDTNQHDPAAILHPKHVDQPALAKACGAICYRVDDPGDAVSTVVQAAESASTGCCVAVVNISTEVLEATIIESQHPPAADASSQIATPAGIPTEADIASVTQMLERSRRPILIAGRGATGAATRQELVTLADRAGALLATSLPAKDLFVGEPSSLGVVGGFAHPLARDLLAQADCIVAFGAGLNSFTTAGGTLFPQADVCQVALDVGTGPSAMDGRLVIRADAGQVARRVLTKLPVREDSADSWRPAAIERLIAYDPVTDFDDRSTPEAIDPRSLLATLNVSLPRDRAVVLDAGHFTGFAVTHMETPGPQRFTACLDYASVALGHGTALGVCVADRSICTILVIGDGGLLMSLGELDTASRYGLPIVIVVVNDAAYGAELHYLALKGVADAADTTVFEERDFARVAAALGVESMVVRSVEDAQTASRLVERTRGPVLLDCRVVRDVRARWLEELFSGQDGDYGR